MIHAALLALSAASFALSPYSSAPDTDGDGLSDFLELHKYLTDPAKADSDGDGVPDGDWLERREYAYTVRSVVHVMRPVTPAFLNDAYQDARVLDETDDYVELEVIHYPLVDLRGVAADGNEEDVSHWLTPGPTSNASRRLGRSIQAAMKKSGADMPDVERVDGVAAASRWLLGHTEHKDRFTTFITAIDERGKFFIPEELADYAKSQAEQEGLSAKEAWPRELEAAGMFKHQERGSCTSSAIYLSGCLRALGVPTRTVLCIPIIDAGDEREWELLEKNVRHNGVREAVDTGLFNARNGWASHTFNEVYVEGRWHRLNYSAIDAGILDENYFGLMTHIATFHDWADARMWETVGRRSTLSNKEKKDDIFGHNNPYSAISLRDSFGVHCKVENPAADSGAMAVKAIYWTDSTDLPADILSSNSQRGRTGLIAEVPVRSMDVIIRHLERSKGEVTITGDRDLSTRFHPGCVWFKSDRAYLFLPIDRKIFESLAKGSSLRASVGDEDGDPLWTLDETIQR